MRAARPADTAAVHRVCLLTADAGGDASALHADADLPGLVWASPYLHAPGAVGVVVEDGDGVAGYCVGVPDTVGFEDWLESTWLPPLRRRRPPGSGRTPADAALVDRLYHPPRTDPALLRTHPAHLHVDLLPRLQGRGWGRRVLETVCAALASAGAPGVHLGVDPANTGARAFYDRLGFTAADGGEQAHVLVRDLVTRR